MICATMQWGGICVLLLVTRTDLITRCGVVELKVEKVCGTDAETKREMMMML